MKGREERDQKNNEWLKAKLVDAPKPLVDYMKSFARKETTTQRVYFNYLSDFLEFIGKTMNIDINNYESYTLIKKMDIDSYMNYTAINKKTGKKCGAGIRNAKLIAVTSFFNFLVDNDIVIKNPCAKVDKIKETVEKPVTYLTIEEIENVRSRILDLHRTGEHDGPWIFRDYAIFILACTTGMRQSAIREMNIEDIDLSQKEITVTEKGNRTKKMYLSTQTCEALQRWLDVRETLLEEKECDAVFISNRRQRMGRTAIEHAVSKWTSDIDKHITPHKLRATCAMNLYEATGDIYLVAQQLGHKSIKNTQIYAKATQKKMKDTAELMDKIYG